MERHVYMACESVEGPVDSDGEYTYRPNPLCKYVYRSCLWERKLMPGRSYGVGLPGIAVKTTMRSLKLLGWEEDYEKYKCCKAYYDNFC